MKSCTSWAIWNTDDGKKAIADNHAIIMDRATAYETMRSILSFYESVSDTEIADYNNWMLNGRFEVSKEEEEEISKRIENEQKYKPTYMFIIKKINEPCYKFKFGGYRENNLLKIQKQLDSRINNLEKESDVPVDLVDSFIYVHNAPGIHRRILETYGSFRDEFDWYVLKDDLLAEIIDFIKKEILHG